jgi:HD superfamily phosphodiesterase
MNQFLLETEEKYLQASASYLEQLFKGKHLPSHDPSHHLRVWHYARRLVLSLSDKCRLSRKDILCLFFSCLFHDSGFTISHGKDHGQHSRRLFESFSSQLWSLGRLEKETIFRLIEEHDNKEKISKLAAEQSDACNLLLLLSVCDDLDAYGAIGVLRYTEINLMRGIPEKDIPSTVIENLSHRMASMKNIQQLSPHFFQHHMNRADSTMQFFREAVRHSSASKRFISMINQNILLKKMDYPGFISKCESENLWPDDRFRMCLFNDLGSPMNQHFS